MNRKSIAMAVFGVVALLCSSMVMVEGRRSVDKHTRISPDNEDAAIKRQKQKNRTLDILIPQLTPAQQKEVNELRETWTRDVPEEAMRGGSSPTPKDDNNMTASEKSYDAMLTKIMEFWDENTKKELIEEEKEREKEKEKRKQKLEDEKNRRKLIEDDGFYEDDSQKE
eukprot:Filipodium_phascolosomae@DN2403_c0_g1_i2.p1